MKSRVFKEGFTLIELLIAVAIVSILGVLAYPSYAEHIQDGRRADIQQQLLQTGAVLERIYSRNGGYPDADQFPLNTDSLVYQLTYINLDKPENAGNFRSRGFRLIATPLSGGPQASDPCGVLTLEHTGETGDALNACW